MQVEIEKVLCAFEQEWAAFCTDVEDTRSLIDLNLSKWVEFEQHNSGIKNVLADVRGIVDQDTQDKIDHQNIEHAVLRYQVCKWLYNIEVVCVVKYLV